MKVVSDSSKKTKELGRLLAKEILKEHSSQPVVIGLEGNLGSGKTTFIQGFARGLSIKNRITSPTFVIFRSYKLRATSCELFFHMDAYRIKKLSELEPIAFKEIISVPKSILLIEWAEKIKKALPRKMIWLEFKHGRKENERIIKFES